MIARRACVLAALGLLACNDLIGLHDPAVKKPPPAPFTAYTSGTRLRAEVYDVDGVRALHGWYDTEREETCRFNYGGTPGGTHVCIPTSAETVTAFADAACTQPLHRQYGTDSNPPYLVAPPADACAAQPTVYAVGGRLDGQSFYQLDSGRCDAESSPNVTLYSAGFVVPLDSFVHAREAIEDRGGRIATLAYVADDGAREAVAAYDTERLEPVASWAPQGDVARFVPSHVAWEGDPMSGFFADDACTIPVAADFSFGNATCPITAVGVPNDATITFRNAGGRVPTERVRTLDMSHACSALMPIAQPFSFYNVGDPVPTTSFAPSTFVNVGAGRVQLRFAGADGEGPVAPTTADGFEPYRAPSLPLFDTEDQQPCTLAQTADGVTRCMPESNASLVFSDAACTVRALATQSTTVAVVELTGGALAAYALGAPLEYGYQADGTGQCQISTGTYYAIGKDVSTTFEAVSDVRE